ncbi:hypothetical protein L2D00_04725 [Hyphomonadaceae bacterium BL14]|nr:hypothetical protein L2D00_04725 [Hyphomonadaceae bacterium BL14]
MDQIASFLQERFLVGLLESLFYGFLTSTIVVIGTLVWRNTVKFSDGLGRGFSETVAVFRERRIQAALDEIAIVGRVYKILIHLVFILPVVLFLAAAIHIVGSLFLYAVATDAVVGSALNLTQIGEWDFPGYLLAVAVAVPLAFWVFRGWVVRLMLGSIMTLIVLIFGGGALAIFSPLVLSEGWVLPAIAYLSPLVSAIFGGWLVYVVTPEYLKQEAQFSGFNIFTPISALPALIVGISRSPLLLGGIQHG